MQKTINKKCDKCGQVGDMTLTEEGFYKCKFCHSKIKHEEPKKEVKQPEVQVKKEEKKQEEKSESKFDKKASKKKKKKKD